MRATGNDETITEVEQRWKLRDRCLRIASYYRVMNSCAVASERKRLRYIKDRFQRWATSWLNKLSTEADAGRREEIVEEERGRRGDQPSANTRMEPRRPDMYRGGVRRYKPRARPEERHKRLIRKQLRRTSITVTAQIGPRVHEDMLIIAYRCVKERRGQG